MILSACTFETERLLVKEWHSLSPSDWQQEDLAEVVAAILTEPGQVLVSERTLTRVQDIVDATEVGELQLKGVSRQTKIYKINEAVLDTIPSAASGRRV